MDVQDSLAGLSPEEQTEWLKQHMPEWDRFIEDIRVSEEQLAQHRASGAPGYPTGWMELDEYWRQRAVQPRPE